MRKTNVLTLGMWGLGVAIQGAFMVVWLGGKLCLDNGITPLCNARGYAQVGTVLNTLWYGYGALNLCLSALVFGWLAIRRADARIVACVYLAVNCVFTVAVWRGYKCLETLSAGTYVEVARFSASEAELADAIAWDLVNQGFVVSLGPRDRDGTKTLYITPRNGYGAEQAKRLLSLKRAPNEPSPASASSPGG